MKKIRILTVLAAMLLSCGIAIAQIVIGDVNQDQKLNAKDITALADSVVKGKQSRRLDLNEDGKVNVADVTKVLNLIGAQNAVKKAYQMTDLFFTPLAPIGYRFGFFEEGVNYQGVIYSSAKELEKFVGNDISIYTYMTAIHNPRSKIYTEDISQPPYHGLNCRTYYGAVCSSFVSHALGIVPKYWANDFPLSDLMREVDFTNPDSIQIADVLWRKGHVALITDIIKDGNNMNTTFEISECIDKGCRRYSRSRKQFIDLMNASFTKVFRYTELYKNTDYTPYPEFVAVKGETPVGFEYNDDLCVDRGDRSCYREDEEVVINVMRDYERMEIYKDGNLLYEKEYDGNHDVKLSNLEYGDYKARIIYTEETPNNIHAPTMNTRSGNSETFSYYTYWKVVNVEVVADRTNGRIYFSSANAVPQCVRYCNIHGNGGSLVTSNIHILSKEEKLQGYIDVLPDEIKQKYPYVRVNFVTDYGRVINRPINWFE